ncbi:hypothetical protein [Bacillus cereus group sp. Bce002]|uniref:hypothetical protein n=1 Tax=Bacillus cereus group sp. Bce002 TaxID=3445259 RepID=UPI003F280B18
MIQIKRDNLHILAESHYKEFFEKRGFLKELKELKEKETNVLQKRFFTYLYSNIKDIIMGNPKCLNRILESIKNSNKFIMHLIAQLNTLGAKLNSRTKKQENLIKEKEILIREKALPTQLLEIEIKIHKVESESQLIKHYIEEGKKLNNKIEKIFNYPDFRRQYGKDRKENKNKWGAYELVKKLKIEVCPYCNRQFISIAEPVIGEKGKTRPELDHFYSQARYPFFAVSFFNLIPCCHVCNANLKGSKEIDIETLLHPYEEGFGDLVEFTVKFNEEEDEIDYVNAWLYNPQMFSIDFKLNEIERQKYSRSELRSLLYKINNNKRTFKLKSLYNVHTDYVGEIIAKSIEYNDDRIESMCKDFPDLFPAKEDAVRLIYSNYVETEKIDKRVLAKLTRDITKEFGINYT